MGKILFWKGLLFFCVVYACVSGENLSFALTPEEKVERIRGWELGSPGQAWTKEALGYAYGEMGRYEDARRAFRLALHYNAKSLSALSGLGQMCLALKDYSGAAEAFEKTLETVPKKGEYLMLASVYEAMGKKNRALDTYERGLKVLPGNVDCIKGKGYLFFRAKEYSKALRIFGDLEKEDPLQADYLALGYLWNALGNFEKAQNAFYRGLEVSSQDLSLLKAYGSACYALGETDKAAKVFHRALSLDTKDTELWTSWAYVLYRKGRLSEARKALEKAIALDSSEGDFVFLGYLLKDQGDLPRALKFFERAFKSASDKIRRKEAASALGYVLVAQGRDREALGAFREALMLEGSPQSYNDYGSAFIRLGMLANAKEAFQRALIMQPEDTGALYNLALVALKEKNLLRATMLAKKLIVLDPPAAQDIFKQLRYYQ